MKSIMKKGAALMLLGACLAVSGLCPVRAEGGPSVSGNDFDAGYSAEAGEVSAKDAGSGGSGGVEATEGIDADMESAGSTGGDAETSESDGTGIAADAASEAVELGEADGETTEGQELASPQELTAYPDDRLMQWNMGNSSGKYGNSFDTYAVFDDNVIAALYSLGNDTYRLELTGTGEMAGLGDYSYQPYRAYRTKIISLTVGEGITNIGKDTFAKFSNLLEYTLPASVKTIGVSAFEYCTSLRSVVIPDTVDSISNYCFQHCEGATSLTIPGDLEYASLYIPFYAMTNLKDIYITPGKTGVASVSQVDKPTASPANISDRYTIHFMEGVTEIQNKVFANTKASRIEIADSVTTIGTDAFAKKAFDKSTIPDYIVLGDNTRSIAAKAFMASVETITPTTVEIGNVYQYEYDWVAVRRDVTFVARLNALKELSQMVASDIQEGTLSQEGKYPPGKWQELLDKLAEAEGLVDAGCSDKIVITEVFTQLYGLYHYEPTTSFVVSVPASIGLSENLEDGHIEGEIPFTVRYLFPDSTYRLSVTVDEGSLVLQDAGSGRTIFLSAQTEGTAWDVDSSGAAVDGEGFYNGAGKISLSGERSAGYWEGTLRLVISCSQ